MTSGRFGEDIVGWGHCACIWHSRLETCSQMHGAQICISYYTGVKDVNVVDFMSMRPEGDAHDIELWLAARTVGAIFRCCTVVSYVSTDWRLPASLFRVQ